MNKVHFTANYLLNPVHPISVILIGCGGTGSQVLNNLARINHAITMLEHPGLTVLDVDDDKVTEFNCGRKLFSPADIGNYKSSTLINRLNRFYGTNWDSSHERFMGEQLNYNIIISCVDNL